MTAWTARSLVVLGDSTALGLGDLLPAGHWRGVGPLLSAALDARLTNVSYTGARTACVRRTQVPAALPAISGRSGPARDVAVVIVGMNDTLRSDFNPGAVRADLAAVVADLHAAGAVVLLVRYHDHGRVFRLPGPLRRALRARVDRLNAAIDAVVAEHGAGCVGGNRNGSWANPAARRAARGIVRRRPRAPGDLPGTRLVAVAGHRALGRKVSSASRSE